MAILYKHQDILSFFRKFFAGRFATLSTPHHSTACGNGHHNHIRLYIELTGQIGVNTNQRLTVI